MVGKHSFPSLKLGSDFGQAAAATASLPSLSLTSRGSKNIAAASKSPDQLVSEMLSEDSDQDSASSIDSYTSEDAIAAYDFVRRLERADAAEPPPPAGLIPLTGLGRRRYGAVELARDYRARPIRVHRALRPPLDGDVFAWGSNYDGQVIFFWFFFLSR